MENKKQEAIEKAYGEHWETVKEYVDKNGWCAVYWNICELIGYSKPKSEGTKWRPISIKNLETNEGWISILPDGSNLPKEDGHVYIYDGLNAYIAFYDSDVFMFSSGINSDIEPTHYQPIVKPKPPIY